jgi:hypothetical protein
MITLEDMILEAARDGRFRGCAVWRTEGRWEGVVKTDTGFDVHFGPDPASALWTALERHVARKPKSIFD